MMGGKSLFRDQRGAAIIELAIIAPIMATMLIGMVDLGRGYSTKLMLEQAAQRAIEKVMNGQAEASGSLASLKTEAADVAIVPESNVTVKAWHECANVATTNYTDTCSTGQVDRRYLSVSISKTFTPIFALKFAGANVDGTYTVTGKTGVRTQ